jgi:hypothetical protein
MRNLVDSSRVEAELSHHFLAFESRDGKDGILILLPPRTIVVEVPNGRVDILGFVGGVVWLVKDESTNRIGAGGGEIGYSAVYAEPGSKSNEIVVGRGEVGAASNISRDEVVLLGVTGWIPADIRNV